MVKNMMILGFVALAAAACPTVPSGNGEGGGGVKTLIGVNPVLKADFKKIAEAYKMDGNPAAIRIPALYTAGSTVMMSYDNRNAAGSDSAHDIETAFRYSTDNGNTWSKAKNINFFEDLYGGYSDNLGNSSASKANNSTSFIDSQLVQAANGDILSIVTTFPARGGIQGGTRNPISSPFYDKDGVRYLLLVAEKDQSYQAENDKDAPISLFKYMAPAAGGPVTDLDGNPPSDTDLQGYSLDRTWFLSKAGSPVMIDRLPTTGTPQKRVIANVLFAKAPFRAVRTSYAFMNRSTDGGKTWGTPIDISQYWRPSSGNEVIGTNFPGYASSALSEEPVMQYIVSPGRGHRVTGGGHKDRLVTVLYHVSHSTTYNSYGERAHVIYSDDNGTTWKKGSQVPGPAPGGTRTSESMIIETPDNTLLLFARSAGRIGMSESTDGGITWTAQEDIGLYDGQWNGTMISAINLKYSKGPNGEALVALSHPDHATTRHNGALEIGVMRKRLNGSWTVDWAQNKGVPTGTANTYTIPIGESALTDSFGYSCLTELPDGNLGLLFEDGQGVPYVKINLIRR